MSSDSLETESKILESTYDEFKKNRPAWTTSLRREVEHGIFCFGLFLGKVISLTQLQKLGRVFGSLAFLVLRKDRGIIEKQLELIFPEIDAEKRRQWTQECFGHFGQMLFEFLSLPQIFHNEANLLQVENDEALKNAPSKDSDYFKVPKVLNKKK